MGAAGAMERELLEAFEAARKAADAVGEAAAAAGAGEGSRRRPRAASTRCGGCAGLASPPPPSSPLR